MSQYKILSILCIVAFIVLAYVFIFIEPKKHGAGWWVILIFSTILLLGCFIFIFMDDREKGIKRVVIERPSANESNNTSQNVNQRKQKWMPNNKYVPSNDVDEMMYL